MKPSQQDLPKTLATRRIDKNTIVLDPAFKGAFQRMNLFLVNPDMQALARALKSSRFVEA